MSTTRQSTAPRHAAQSPRAKTHGSTSFARSHVSRSRLNPRLRASRPRYRAFRCFHKQPSLRHLIDAISYCRRFALMRSKR
eukprot:30294-Pelagococcus_subviridis.AAC.57